MNRANAWTTYEEADLKALEELCKEYKDFLSNGKTERECVAQSIELAESRISGFRRTDQESDTIKSR